MELVGKRGPGPFVTETTYRIGAVFFFFGSPPMPPEAVHSKTT